MGKWFLSARKLKSFGALLQVVIDNLFGETIYIFLKQVILSQKN
jgi:hypothetical protein